MSRAAAAACVSLLPSADPLLERWRALIGAGYSLLERGGPASGPFVRRWGLRVNVPELAGEPAE